MKDTKKYVPLEKMSKKQKKEYYSRQRRDWGGLSPITRCPDDPKIYKRAKAKRAYYQDDGMHAVFILFFCTPYRVFRLFHSSSFRISLPFREDNSYTF